MSVDALLLTVLRLDINTFAYGLYPLATRFNHSCRPNACAVPLPDPHCIEVVQARPRRRSVVQVVTLADIGAGEEVCLSYLGSTALALPVDQRINPIRCRPA